MRSLISSILFIVFILGFYGLFLIDVYSYSYYEPFNSGLTGITNNGWKIHTLRGRSGIFYTTTNTNQRYDDNQDWYSAFTVGTANGVSDNSLIIYGRGNNCQLALNNYWAGNSIKFIPTSNSQIAKVIVATPEEPFGFAVVHRMSRVDNLSDYRGQVGYHQSAINIWLAEENYKTNEWDNYDNFILLYQELVAGNTTSEWGYYKGGKYPINLATGTFYDNWSNSTSFNALRGANMQDGSTAISNMNFYGGNRGTTNANTSVFGVKMVHDGSKVYIYFNPSPYAPTGSWYKVAETSVGWYSNLVVEFGHESLIFVSESQEAYWDDFTIRTVTSNTYAYITPYETVVGKTNIYTIVISNDITSSDSGVGEIKVKKPSGFSAWDTNAVWVETYYITGANTNNRIFSGEPAANQFLVRQDPYDPDSLLIRFRMVSSTDNSIVRAATPDKTIKVSFRLITPSTPDISGSYKFYVYVDCNKELNTGTDISYATTGWKRAREIGTGMTVKVYSKPYIYASINYSPTPMYEGNQFYTMFYNLSTSGLNNNPDISSVEIYVPNGFVLSNAFKSLLVPSNYIYLTNYGGSNRVRVNYAAAGNLIPGVNGLDRIEFYVIQTPDLPISIETSNFTWPMWAYDRFGNGMFGAGTNTNSTYKSQVVQVIIPSARALSSIYPPKADNSRPTNTFSYTVINDGPLGNDIIKMFILFDTNYITNYAWGLSNNSTYFPALLYTTNISGLGFGIFVDYTNASKPLRSGSNDVIYFTTVHKRSISDPPVGAAFVVYADNGNTEGLRPGSEYSPNSWTVLITPPDPEGKAYIATNKIHTTTVSFSFTNFIYNTGAPGNNISKARISVPSRFVINNVSLIPGQSWLTNSANIQVSGNNIILNYYNEGVGLKSVYENSSYFDRILITLSNTNYFAPTNLVIQTYVSNSRGETNAQDKSSSERQVLYIEWPDVQAWVSLYSTNTNSYIGLADIDSSTITNVLFLRVSNLGVSSGSGNKIYRLMINIPTNISTNVFGIQSSVISFDNIWCTFSNNYVVINYLGELTNIPPGGEDLITFKMVDFVENSRPNVSFVVSASNQKAFQSITNGSWTLNFKLPHVYMGAKIDSQVVYTSSTPTNVSLKFIITNAGFGSNRLYRVKVNIPPVYQGKIVGVSSSIIGGSGIAITPSNFTINYINLSTNLPAGYVDNVIVTFSNTFSVPTNGEFVVMASNGSDYYSDGWEEGTNIIYSTNDKKLWITEQPSIAINPTQIWTTQNTNDFVLTITNGLSVNSKDVHRIAIYLPSIFDISNVNVLNTTPTTLSANPILTVDTNNRRIIVSFVSEKLSGTKVHSVQIRGIDNFNYGETNVIWNVGVDYNDGYSNNNFPYIPSGSGSTFVKLPPSRIYGKLIPNNVYYDLDEIDMKLELTNFGEKYNDVYWVRIFLPNIVTNVVVLSNKIPANINYYSSSNMIFVDYAISNTNLASGVKDIIYFTAYDNVDNYMIYFTNLKVEVANYPSNVYYTNALELVPGDLNYNIDNPPYRANYRVEPNIVSAFENGFVMYKVFVDNAGNTGNNARTLVLSYPFVLITNDMIVSNSYGNALVYLLTNSIVVDYTNTSGLAVGSNDIIYVHARDNWVIGDTNGVFNLKVKFDTSGGKFVKGRVVGGTNIVSYISSPPYAYTKLLYREVYYPNPNPTITIILSNGGSGDNSITRLDINIPTALQIGFNIANVTSDYATNKSYSGGVLTLLYDNLPVNVVDYVRIKISNTNVAGTSFNITGTAYNGVTNASIIPTGLLDMTLRFIQPPTAELLTTSLNALLRTNVISVKIDNNTSGDASVKNFLVSLNSPFTNVISVSNTKPSVISISNNTNIYVSYTNGLSKGDNDSLTIVAVDDFNIGNTNSVVGFYVNEGLGYVPPNIGLNSNIISIVMPPAQGYADLVNKYVLLSVVPGVPSTNVVRIVFTNTGEEMNNITFVKVVLPSLVSNFLSLSNQIGGAIISNSNNFVFIHYTNDGIASGQKDIGWFVFENYYNAKTNVKIDVYYDNGLGVEQFINSSPGNTLNLLFDFPEAPADFRIIKPYNIAWSIDTNHTIVFRVDNNSYSYPIVSIRIPYASSNYSIENVRSSNNYISSWSVSNGYLFVNTFIPTRRSEYILVDVSYNAYSNTNIVNTTNNMKGMVYYQGGEDYEDVNVLATETADFIIAFANFGRVLGLVKPYYKDITVKLVYSGTESVVIDNVYSNNILSSLTTNTNINNVLIGSYRLDFIPSGTYDILVTSSKYRKLVIKNITVSANRITNIGMIVLSNMPFSTEAREEQSVVSLDDGNTALIVPPGALLNDFSVDIISRLATAEEQAGVLNSKGASRLNDLSQMKVYELIMKTIPGSDIFENPLKSDVILKFYYDENYITSQGWSEDSLSVWYWKDTTREWVRIGGKVDKDNNFIYIKTRYLHRVYAIMGDGNIKKEGIVRNVKASPNPFTPNIHGNQADYKYGMLKITFELDKPYDKGYVKIYDLSGKLLRILEFDGSFGQGEVYWDGKDQDGVYVRNGAYIYVVVAGGTVGYRSTVILVK
ncbi:MAG: FlgD immunoglobulin-like domain containing protein [Brevinematia bacterium]